jgi:hypothetical protein
MCIYIHVYIYKARTKLGVMYHIYLHICIFSCNRETVYQARFTNRIPYPVDISLDARQIREFLNVKKIRDDKCQNFNWYLKEIYPGLQMDKNEVEVLYKNHLASNYFENKLKPLMDQYNEKNNVVLDENEILKLKKRENVPEEIGIYVYISVYICIYIYVYT